MTNARISKNTKKTLTSGKITNLAADCEELNIRGAVALHQEVHLRKISTHGHSSFHALVKADIFRNTGTCTIKDIVKLLSFQTLGS